VQSLGQLLSGLADLIFALVALGSFFMARRNANNLHELTQNTNSIKDALVKVTGEAEHAKGVLQGFDQATKSSQ
jgi:hypothetical protein